jgi:hypothetical protein
MFMSRLTPRCRARVEDKVPNSNQWQALREFFWPSRYNPVASHERRIALLQAVIAIAIALAAGPEILAAIEMTALLELLGAVLFLVAMSAGARLVALRVRSAIHDSLFLVPPGFVLRCATSIPARALALLWITGHATWCLALTLNGRYVGVLTHR